METEWNGKQEVTRGLLFVATLFWNETEVPVELVHKQFA